jgi:hypothetical protein
MRANCRSIPKDFHFPIFGPGQFELDFAAHFDLRLQGLSQWNAESVLFGSQKKFVASAKERHRPVGFGVMVPLPVFSS